MDGCTLLCGLRRAVCCRQVASPARQPHHLQPIPSAKLFQVCESIAQRICTSLVRLWSSLCNRFGERFMGMARFEEELKKSANTLRHDDVMQCEASPPFPPTVQLSCGERRTHICRLIDDGSLWRAISASILGTGPLRRCRRAIVEHHSAPSLLASAPLVRLQCVWECVPVHSQTSL